MRELVLVVSDLFLPEDAPERQWPEGVALPGLQQLTRFGARGKIEGGWRSWLARWLTGADSGAPATVAATVVSQRAPTTIPRRGSAPMPPPLIGPPASPHAPPGAQSRAPAGSPQSPLSQAPMVWMATPVHLVTSLASLHLDRRGLLRLSAEDSIALSTEFQRVFHDSGFVLEPLDSGDFVLFGPQLVLAPELEPARLMGASMADVQQGNASDPMLRKLGAEIEMWLHEHPVNEARQRRGEAPVTGLWLWGGGPTAQHFVSDSRPAASPDIAFGRDAYLQGLWASIGQKVFPLPPQLAAVFGYPDARRAVLVIEIGSMLQPAPTWTLIDALARIDSDFITPAVQAVGAAQLERLVLLANDRQLALRASDRFKLWRRTPAGLSGLQ